jgi:hypothetical protein
MEMGLVTTISLLAVSTARPMGLLNPVAPPLIVRSGATLPLAVRL